MNDENPWFERKRYGYGAGLPIAWQGWAALGVYTLIVLVASMLPVWDEEVGLIGFFALFIPATAVLLYVAALKTRGGWRWRWGDDE